MSIPLEIYQEGGAIFERVLCVSFKDSDFGIRRVEAPEIDTSGLSAAAEAEALKDAEAQAYEEAHIIADSVGTKMMTYRAYVKLTDKSILGNLGGGAA